MLQLTKFVFHRCSEGRRLINFVSSFIAPMSTVSKEFTIPFPGGHIAAKSWGDEVGIPVLALHGWQDNLGSFDRLVPLLPDYLHIVAFDFLGHGLSSHKPPGCFYNYMDMLIEIQRVVDHLKWKHFNILAHSLGGTLGLLYGSLYPEVLTSLVCLDIMKPFSGPLDQLPVSTKRSIQKMLKLESKLENPAPLYSLDNAHKRFMNGAIDQITLEATEVLLRRGTKPSESGDGVIFTRDIRVQNLEGMQLFSHADLKAYMHLLKCHLLIIAGEESKIFMSKFPEVIKDFTSIYKANCKSFDIVKVKGSHFVHINNPEFVAPHVSAFLKKYGQLIET